MSTILLPGRPVEAPEDGAEHRAGRAAVSDRRRAAALVAAHGDDALAPFVLGERRALHVAADGVLAYRIAGRTAVVGGDPVAAGGRAPELLADFAERAREQRLRTVVHGAADRHLDGYREQGLRTICVGEEAVVDSRSFGLRGQRMKAVRHALSRQRRHGWSLDCVAGAALGPAAAELHRLEQAWRAEQPRICGFAMTSGRLHGTLDDARATFVLARDPAGELRAALRMAPFHDGLSLDVQRRIGPSPNGLTDAMIATVLLFAAEQGIARVSLNFAGFSQLLDPTRARGPRARLARAALRRTGDRFQLDRLVTFCDKFGPTWEPRHLVLPRHASPALAGLRVLQAEQHLPGAEATRALSPAPRHRGAPRAARAALLPR
ncbi:phosphatidylglycerol lysyltransferase domain-containing protein [Patulibacter defluvii]|uniref:phosphatidylglycerol lysyltransferase domain-containing protein n=1 Tax=Patulibacter defluvii TaxID=3095358 RepID=UPI002A760117|nr:phosphatidylglycerol lysyltransferase domain-containing protein [Patulibacter sp. DM4]